MGVEEEVGKMEVEKVVEVGKVRRREELEGSSSGAVGGDSPPVSGGEKEDQPESGGDNESSADYYEVMDYELLDRMLAENDDKDLSDDDFYNDGRRKLTDEEYAEYCDQVEKSDGFDVEMPRSNVYDIGYILPHYVADDSNRVAELAILRNKEEKGENLKLTKVLKVNWEVACPMNYYLTFEAEDLDAGHPNTYQAKVVLKLPVEKSEVPIFRIRNTLADFSS